MRRTLSLWGLAALLAVSAPGSAALGQAQRASAQAGGYAVADTIALAQIERAFSSGDVATLVAHVSEPLDLAIFGHGASYTRSQAALVLTDFFRRNPPGEVSFREEVAATDRRSVIGQYLSAGNKESSAVLVRLRARDGRWEIRSIRIERTGRR